MEQLQAVEIKQNQRLDTAAVAVSDALECRNLKYGFIGGYAVTLLGGDRVTRDVDVIVADDAKTVREILLASDDRFSVTAADKLKLAVPVMDGQEAVTVELLRGGSDLMKLPDINKVPLITINPSNVEAGRADRELPLIHPAVLVLTKIKRWMFIAESTRPASIGKAEGDLADIITLLKWLQNHNLMIDFSKYPEKPKEQLLPGLRMLLQQQETGIYDLLKSTLHPDDFELIR